MKKPRIDKFEIKTWDLKITKPEGYSRGDWSFKYQVKKNGKVVKKDKLDSTYTVSFEAIRAAFRRGCASQLVLETNYEWS